MTRNAFIGGLGLFGYRGAASSSASSSEGSPNVGSIVSSATKKMGLSDNQFSAGGFQLALIGGFFAVARVVGYHVIEYLKKKIVISAEFDSRDESFHWIMDWINAQPFSKKVSQFSVTSTSRQTTMSPMIVMRGGTSIKGDSTEEPQFLPAPGLHFFWHKKRLFWISRSRSYSNADRITGAALESVTINTIGYSRGAIQSLIFEARRLYIINDRARTVIYQVDKYGQWNRTRSKPKRPLDTIVMDRDIKALVVNDAKEFLTSEKWYSERGIPYRRGILLYGSPGTGKTSFLHALAGELGLNIYVINLSGKMMSDDTLSDLVALAPSRCLMLIEDVDSAFVQRDSKEAGHRVTFSGLLNAIDGLAAQEGRIFCLTTNHLDRLDEALIRPGRIDVRIHFGKATRDQAQELFIKFYPHLQTIDVSENPTQNATETLDSSSVIKVPQSLASTFPLSQMDGTRLTAKETEELAASFAQAIPDQEFSIAQLQGYLMGYKKSPELAVKHIDEFVRLPRGADVSDAAEKAPDNAAEKASDVPVKVA
ncbi:hypothetical protein BGX31_005309 [Mortierella sp. GBA43]|nr:hypothetical protein BGX31_005309 [Mortierella sp. GBA43]